MPRPNTQKGDGLRCRRAAHGRCSNDEPARKTSTQALENAEVRLELAIQHPEIRGFRHSFCFLTAKAVAIMIPYHKSGRLCMVFGATAGQNFC